jgi:hypothetical protein
MYGLAVIQQDYPQVSSFSGDKSPPPNTAVRLMLLTNWLLDGRRNPFIKYTSAIGARPDVAEIRRGFQR